MTEKQLPAKLPKKLDSMLGSIGLPTASKVQKLPAAERLQYAEKGGQIETLGLLYKGMCLVGVKEELAHGEYLPTLAKHKLSSTDAARAVNAWHLSLRIKPSNLTTLVNLSPVRLYLLLAWETEEIDAFLEGEVAFGITYEEALIQPIRELEARIRESNDTNSALEKKLQNYSTVADALTIENDHLKDLLANKHRDDLLPEYVSIATEESTSLSTEIEIRLEKFERLFHSLRDQLTHGAGDEEEQRVLRIAEKRLYHNLNGVVALAIPLLLVMREQYDEQVIGRLDDYEAIFTRDEALTAVVNRKTLLQRQQAEKDDREAIRESKKPKGRGRPKKLSGKK